MLEGWNKSNGKVDVLAYGDVGGEDWQSNNEIDYGEEKLHGLSNIPSAQLVETQMHEDTEDLNYFMHMD